jgi:hypothetical protein
MSAGGSKWGIDASVRGGFAGDKAGLSETGRSQSRGFPGFGEKVKAADFFFWTVQIDSPKNRPTRRRRGATNGDDEMRKADLPTALRAKSFSDLNKINSNACIAATASLYCEIVPGRIRVRDVACAVSAD